MNEETLSAGGERTGLCIQLTAKMGKAVRAFSSELQINSFVSVSDHSVYWAKSNELMDSLVVRIFFGIILTTTRFCPQYHILGGQRNCCGSDAGTLARWLKISKGGRMLERKSYINQCPGTFIPSFTHPACITSARTNSECLVSSYIFL